MEIDITSTRDDEKIEKNEFSKRKKDHLTNFKVQSLSSVEAATAGLKQSGKKIEKGKSVLVTQEKEDLVIQADDERTLESIDFSTPPSVALEGREWIFATNNTADPAEKDAGIVIEAAVNSTAVSMTPNDFSKGIVALMGLGLGLGVTMGSGGGKSQPPSAPTLTITDDKTDVTNGVITYTFTFSENVTNFNINNIHVAHGVASNFTTVDGKTYTVQVTPTANEEGADMGLSVDGTLVGLSFGSFTIAKTADAQAYDTRAPSISSNHFNVAENTTAVGTLAATDANAVTWALSGTGVDNAKFDVDEVTGALTFLRGGKDFEQPDDAGANGTYNITLVATDAAGNVSAPRAITVTLSNLNEAQPATVGTVAAQTAGLGQDFGLDLSGKFADPDVGDSLRFSATGLPAGLSIHATTGVISGRATVAGPASVVVTATDADGLTATQSFSLSVVTPPQIQSFSTTSTVVKSSDALSLGVVFSEAVTVSGMPSLIFTMNGRTVIGTYSSGTGTNSLVFTTTAPLGDGNAVSIGAATLNGGAVTSNVSGLSWNTDIVGQSITSLVIDNTPPTIPTTSLNVAENTTVVATLAATDANAVTWALSGTGVDNGKFALNATTGALTFLGTKDHENPDDAGTNGTYNITVMATDAAGNVSAPRAITVTLSNVNETPAAVGTVTSPTAGVGQTFSLDLSGQFADPDVGDSLRFSATGLPAGLSIHATTGVISGRATVAGPASVVVTATDADGLTATQSFSLSVVTPPQIQSFSTTSTVVKSSDALSLGVVFSEAVTVSGMPSLIFTMNGRTVIGTYSSGTGTNSLVFTTTAPLGDGNAVSIGAATLNGGAVTSNVSGLSWNTDIVGQSITSLVIDNTPPTIPTTSLNVAENTTVVATLAATDANAVTWALSGTGVDNGKFALNATTGALTFLGTKDHENPDDAGTNGTYNITVVATDAAGNVSAPRAITVTLSNVNEAPTAVGTVSAPTAVVNQAYSLNLSGQFADPDVGDSLRFSATGLPAGLSIHATTGVISGTATVAGPASVVVTATDADGLTATQSFSLSVVAPPQIQSFSTASTLVKGGTPLSFDVVFSEAVTVSGSPTLTFTMNFVSVTATYAAGSSTNRLTFSATAPAIGDGNGVWISGATLNGGAITGDATGLSWNTNNLSMDSSSSPGIGTLVIDNALPLITSSNNFNAAENTTVAGTLIANDANAVTWALSGTGADNAKFALTPISSSRAALTFLGAKNFEQPDDTGTNGIYNITVVATDGAGNVSATKAMTVTLTNVNEAPTVTTPISDPTAFYLGGAMTPVDAADAFADPDSLASGFATLTYSLSGAPSGVVIDANTGRITGTPTTAGNHSITVTASDGTHQASDTFVLTVYGKSNATASISRLVDNVGFYLGSMFNGVFTDDTQPKLEGTLNGSLINDEKVRIFDGATFLGYAVVTGTQWSYQDTRTLAHDQAVSYTAKVEYLLGDTSAASTAFTATIDTVPPTDTITGFHYDAATDTLLLTGTNFDTLLNANQTMGVTDIKGQLYWPRLFYDFDGDNNPGRNGSFLSDDDIFSAKVIDATHLSIVLDPSKANALEGDPRYTNFTPDRLDVSAGFSKDAALNTSTTDAVSNAAITPLVTNGDLNFGKLGGDSFNSGGYSLNLINKVTANGKDYYFWDKNGNGTPDGNDRTNFQWLDNLFNQGNDITEDNSTRTLTIGTYTLKLPTQMELQDIRSAAGGRLPPDWAGDSPTPFSSSTQGYASDYHEQYNFVDGNVENRASAQYGDGSNYNYVAFQVIG